MCKQFERNTKTRAESRNFFASMKLDKHKKSKYVFTTWVDFVFKYFHGGLLMLPSFSMFDCVIVLLPYPYGLSNARWRPPYSPSPTVIF